jgi:hypothetical protein
MDDMVGNAKYPPQGLQSCIVRALPWKKPISTCGLHITCSHWQQHCPCAYLSIRATETVAAVEGGTAPSCLKCLLLVLKCPLLVNH